jgi:hypothetical protein
LIAAKIRAGGSPFLTRELKAIEWYYQIWKAFIDISTPNREASQVGTAGLPRS